MDAVTLLSQAQHAGLTLTVADDVIHIAGPKTQATAELVSQMGLCKDEIRGLLRFGDLTDWIGATVDAVTWAALQAECERRYGGAWAFTTEPSGEAWHVRRLTAKAG